MKVSELVGKDLDYWVARAMGGEYKLYRFADDGKPPNDMAWVFPEGCHIRATTAFNPSSNWGQGGPIIEREEIYFEPSNCLDVGSIFAYLNDFNEMPGQWGTTHLVAAMRCYVANKLGNEVKD